MGEVISVHKGYRQAALGGIPCSADPKNPASNNNEIKFLSRKC